MAGHVPRSKQNKGMTYSLLKGIALRVALVGASTCVLTTVGIACIVAGVHGPTAIGYVGKFLLLPNAILLQLGVPIAIPLLYRFNILSTTVFLVLQLGYYYGLFRLIVSVFARRGRLGPKG